MQIANKEVTEKIILIYDWAMKPAEYKAIVDVANSIPGVKVITISQYWLDMGLFYANLNQGYFDRYIKNTKFNLDDLFCSHNELPHEIFSNRHLFFQFEGLGSELERAAIFGDIFALLLELIKPSLIIFAHEAFTVERILVRVAKERMFPTASMFHGGFRPNFGYQGLCGDVDLIWVWNDYDAKWLIKYGIDPDRIQIIGCVRYENHFRKYISSLNEDFVFKRKKAKAFIGIAPDKPLITLLTAEINTGFASPCACPRKHRDALRGILKLVESRADLQFIIKAHPGYDYHELYNHILSFNLPNLIFNPSHRLDDVLEATDICIMVNYCTTAALEAMLCHVPILFLDNAIYPIDDFQDILSATNINRPKNISDLDSAINDLLVNPLSHSESLLEAHKLLIMFLGVEGKYPTHRLLCAIEEVLYKKPYTIEDGIINLSEMRRFLQSASLKAINKRAWLLANYDEFVIMYIAASLSGSFNLGSACLRSIFINFNKKNNGAEVKSWNILRWHLLQAYIEGYLSQPRFCLKGLIVLICRYALSPRMFVATPMPFKRMILKQIIYQAFKPKTVNLIKKACFFYRPTL